MPLTPLDRFFSMVRVQVENCWIWTGALSHNGYGRFRVGDRNSKTVRAHRWIYESLIGPIPDGLTLDHLCRRPSCVNPAHLQPTTMRENTMRGDTITAANLKKTHCSKGHPFAGHNLIMEGNRRRCRTCINLKQNRRYHARNASQQAI